MPRRDGRTQAHDDPGSLCAETVLDSEGGKDAGRGIGGRSVEGIAESGTDHDRQRHEHWLCHEGGIVRMIGGVECEWRQFSGLRLRLAAGTLPGHCRGLAGRGHRAAAGAPGVRNPNGAGEGRRYGPEDPCRQQHCHAFSAPLHRERTPDSIVMMTRVRLRCSDLNHMPVGN